MFNWTYTDIIANKLAKFLSNNEHSYTQNYTVPTILLMAAIAIADDLCKSCGAFMQIGPAVFSLSASCGLTELTQNVIRLSHGHSTPSMNISCKSVQPFSRNVADKEISIEALCGLPELTQNVTYLNGTVRLSGPFTYLLTAVVGRD